MTDGQELWLAVALDSLAIAAFICDADGRVVSQTSAAKVVLARKTLRLREGVLGAASKDDSRALDAAIAHAAKGDLARVATLVVRGMGGGGDIEVVDVVALAPRGGAHGPRVLVVVRGVPREPRELAPTLILAFGLTAAEADIAVRLAEGQSREVIAEARNASLGTVRSQIKVLFAKLDVRREAELTARLNRMR